MPRKQSDGWAVELVRPESSRTRQPDVLDDPQLSPSLGPGSALAEIRIPVRLSEEWLNWPTPADMTVWFEGDEQPIDELRDVERERDRAILVGRGGIELEERVQKEYREERRHIAAEELITGETPYAADVDTPEYDTVGEQTLQTASTTQEFEALAVADKTDPRIRLNNDEIDTDRVAWVEEGEEDAQDTVSDVAYSGGTAADFFDSGSGDITITFTPDYEIENPQIAVRGKREDGTDDLILLQLTLDGDVLLDDAIIAPSSLEWTSYDVLQLSDLYDDYLTAETHTIEIDVSSVPGNRSQIIDVFGLVDADETGGVGSFDNTVHEDNGYLNDPSLYATATVEFDDASTAFVIEDVTATIVIDDTSNDQALGISTDRGQSFTTALNTDTLTVTDVETLRARTRVTIGPWEPTGPRDATPRVRYASQVLDSYEITADLRLESLLLDKDYDNDLQTILDDIAGDDEFLYSYRIEDGTPTIAWSQPGQRVADETPELAAEPTVRKQGTTYPRVTIKGSNVTITDERFTASETFQALSRDRIISGSESVRDPDTGENFARDEDYEIKYRSGEIRRTANSDLVAGQEYAINYDRATEGSFTVSDAPAEPREAVQDIAGVVSDRQAEQLAFILATEFNDPRYRGQVVLPRPGVEFDPLEALPVESLSLPDAATPLEIRGEPELTPQGLSLTLGSGDGVDETAQRLARQVQRITRQT